MPAQPVDLERLFDLERPLRRPIGVVRAQVTDIRPAAAPGRPHLGPGVDSRNGFAGIAQTVAIDATGIMISTAKAESLRTRMPDVSQERSWCAACTGDRHPPDAA